MALPVLFAACGADAPVDTSPESDRETLVALFQANEGQNWFYKKNWLTAAPLDEWYGVTIDGDGRIIELDLMENGLRGEILPEIGNLTNLKILDLYQNELSGEIPAELGSLASLRELNLAKNELNGEIYGRVGQPRQPERTEPLGERVERGDTGGVRQPP